MTRLIVFASVILAAIMFASGYVVVYATSMLAIAFDLPGPYSQEPVAWLWVAVSMLILLAVSFAFCRWLAKRVDRRHSLGRAFE